jgi:hypothetical protein
LTIDGTSYESFDIAYEASDDLTNKEKEGAKYPIHAEFSMGINVVDLEDVKFLLNPIENSHSHPCP